MTGEREETDGSIAPHRSDPAAGAVYGMRTDSAFRLRKPNRIIDTRWEEQRQGFEQDYDEDCEDRGEDAEAAGADDVSGRTVRDVTTPKRPSRRVYHRQVVGALRRVGPLVRVVVWINAR